MKSTFRAFIRVNVFCFECTTCFVLSSMQLDFLRGLSVHQCHQKRIKDCFMPERIAKNIYSGPTGVIL